MILRKPHHPEGGALPPGCPIHAAPFPISMMISCVIVLKCPDKFIFQRRFFQILKNHFDFILVEWFCDDFQQNHEGCCRSSE
jgi:hypothetical protein